MTATEYRAALEQLGLTQTGLANLVAVTDRTWRRWAADGDVAHNAALPQLFIIDGAKALSKAIRRTFGRTAESLTFFLHFPVN